MSPSRPEITAALARGVQRLLADRGYAPVLELTLGNGRRADVAGLSPRGEIVIVETKSGVEDFVVDFKWPDYRDYCDAFYFAVTLEFPQALIPADVGLIVADGFGGEILREPARHPLVSARRKAVTLQFARVAALRLLGAGGG
ncbi:MAG: MmcB family DNA repair protein [Hyphomonadaceae bacterium]|nr:MmcB family DNA repair protein [Hyphomonadaceae bacterium]